MIHVTEPFLPPKSEYLQFLDDIWKRNWLTNDGPLVKDFEKRISQYLNTNSHFTFTNNGTIALQLAIKVLELSGEILTTPFSYVATTTSILWENCQPVFVDIDDSTLNINALKIEEKITKRTVAILATHVFGNACDVHKIEEIAKKHNLKVIYDSAHAFGVKVGEKSIVEYGDISCLSTHATKLFHTIEGGGVFTSSEDIKKKVNKLRNFGHNGEGVFDGIGINGKNSEFHAAMGLVNLNHIDEILRVRKIQYLKYRSAFSHLKRIKFQILTDESGYNYSYFPIILETEELLMTVKENLEKSDVSPRRYFFPSLNTLEYVESSDICPYSESISKRILCLPLYHSLTTENQNLIINEILKWV